MVSINNLLKFSEIVYEDSEADKFGVSRLGEVEPGWTKLYGLDDPNTGFAACAYRNNVTGEVVIAYRGTEQGKDNNADVITDIGIAADEFTDQHHQAEQFYDDVIDELNNKNYDKTNIYVTGHSLGGGLAQWVTYRDAQEHNGANIIKQTVTFNAAGIENMQQYKEGTPYNPSATGAAPIINYCINNDLVSSGCPSIGEVRYVQSPQISYDDLYRNGIGIVCDHGQNNVSYVRFVAGQALVSHGLRPIDPFSAYNLDTEYTTTKNNEREIYEKLLTAAMDDPYVKADLVALFRNELNPASKAGVIVSLLHSLSDENSPSNKAAKQAVGNVSLLLIHCAADYSKNYDEYVQYVKDNPYISNIFIQDVNGEITPIYVPEQMTPESSINIQLSSGMTVEKLTPALAALSKQYDCPIVIDTTILQTNPSPTSRPDIAFIEDGDPVITHNVVAGDTLWGIAQSFSQARRRRVPVALVRN